MANTAPLLTNVSAKTINKNEKLTLSLDDVIATDAEGDVLSLEFADGDNYTVSENTITPASNFSGKLQVNITVSDGDLKSNAMIMNVTVGTSTDIETHEQIKLYPNPCTNHFTINAGSETSMLTITDLTGRTVLNKMVSGTVNVEVGHLNLGIYMVRINNCIEKLIIK